MNIDQKISIEILTKYWFEKQKKIEIIESKYLFVGDVHGDFNQFIAPLIYSGTITLKNEIRTIYKSKISNISNVYIPEYKINKSNVEIFYLGDYVDEGIYSRNILCMLNELVRKCENIHLIIGNHDANILGRYLDFKDGTLDFYKLKSYWPTFQKEISSYEEIHSYREFVELKKSKININDFLQDYFTTLFRPLFEMFRDRYLKVFYEINLNDEIFIVSHTLITNRAINELKMNKTRFKTEIKPKPIIDEKYDGDDVNELFRISSSSFISANRLLYNRSEVDLWKNKFIVGHSPGGEYSQMGINIIPSKNQSDRILHTKPIIKDDYKIYYFDLKSSSGYDIDNVSRPDFFYFNKEMRVSNLNAIRTYYSFNDGKIKMEEYRGKNKTDGVNIIF